MKRILITGKGSYIGTNFKQVMEKYPEEYRVEELDMLNESWRRHNFTKYDVVYHVAGIAHIKENPKNEELYYKVNRDLAIEVAKKAKVSGVKQFIFMSSMSVYGILYSDKPISLSTKCQPNTYYGKSKSQAEKKIEELADENFYICIIRPPMVYGDNSPGNMTKLLRLVKKTHIFPTIKNKRSAITIEKLIEVIKEIIDDETKGIILPQNDKYMCTYETVKEKMELEKISIHYVKVFNPILKLLIGKIDMITKCFGDLFYEE